MDKRNTYVRMLLIDYSSAFNTIVPTKLIIKLGLNPALCNWVLDFLTGHPRLVKVVNISTDPQHCGPTKVHAQPPPVLPFTHDCVAMHASNSIKFADDPSCRLYYQHRRDSLKGGGEGTRCGVSAKKTSLKVNKTKEMIVDFS
jgi:gmma-aminobutyric acid receptor subunit gamma/cGMP-dependent protein kinase 2